MKRCDKKWLLSPNPILNFTKIGYSSLFELLDTGRPSVLIMIRRIEEICVVSICPSCNKCLETKLVVQSMLGRRAMFSHLPEGQGDQSSSVLLKVDS